MLLTAHRVKGLEFDHVVVLDGNWQSVSRGEDRDAPRRLYYVAMTRARKTLALARMPTPHPFQDALKDLPGVLRRNEHLGLSPPPSELFRSYRRLSLRDVFLGFAGYRKRNDPVHQAIAALSPGDRLGVQMGSRGRWELLNSDGIVVGQFAGGYKVPDDMLIKSATVLAIASWEKANSDPEYQQGIQCDRWEVVVPELVLEPMSKSQEPSEN